MFEIFDLCGFLNLFLDLGRGPFALVTKFHVECTDEHASGALGARDGTIFVKHVF